MASGRRRRTGGTGRSARRGGVRLGFAVPRDVARSIVGVVLLVAGAVTLIALLLPGDGLLTGFVADVLRPGFGIGAFLLPVILIAAGVLVERTSGRAGAWRVAVVGGVATYLGALGLIHLWQKGERHGEAALREGGGAVGYELSHWMTGLLGPPATFVVLAGLTVAGVLLLLNLPLRSLVHPVAAAGRGFLELMRLPLEEREEPRAGAAGRGRTAEQLPLPPPGPVSAWGRPDDTATARPIPPPAGSPAPLSATFSTVPIGPTAAVVPVATSPERSPRPARDVTDDHDASSREPRQYRLPPLPLLDDIAPAEGKGQMDHERNAAIIVAKLAAFDIPARVTRWNAGPVVTQYEVEPDPSIKVSRIEAAADDLAMALAARTIRIEAPIPGKSVVGLEIPNADFNVVALRRMMEEARILEAPSRLTFALGRDVAGHARAADLGRMPHLLIAGATGSGKSVMVNALIVSFLMAATPDELRFILMDLKRVELAAYNGLPHLMVPVITEPERAKAALRWVVTEMENRYRRFAGAGVRNVTAFNESRADPADRLPFLVIVVDELADLMMREGRAVEDPIVRLAQKARAVGVHMVLATQRPSVNVVTGLIKANFPSRIAFAMASQIDSRTILDTPGAEDLIGRGDMLYQPSDLPRPMRLQGVFVSDREIARVTEHWRAEAEAHYDMAIVETEEEPGGLQEAEDSEADRLLPDAIAVIQEYDRASASLLQRRLRIGYARAARIVDQLEARGFVGPFDGSNARAVLRRPERPMLASRDEGYDGSDQDA
ncbi:MAG: hypothetical protein A2X23_03780 [Chloroflexi bacterium GWC2_73_18]|nr:MAG: hypothetical protein A2X23_03780 [Chloroflexi bacterium GWC2_73_18]